MRINLPRKVTIPRKAIAAVAAGVLALPFLASAASGAPGHRVNVPGSTPTWARPAAAVGTPSAGQKISFRVALPLRNASAAESLAQAVSTPDGARYGQYLSPAQFNTAYAPSAAAVSRVKGFLTGAGITVTGVAEGNRWVLATGTAAQIDAAFATHLRTYRYQGRNLKAPDATLSVPSSVSADVLAVSGLTDALAKPDAHRPADPAPAAAPTNPSPCSTYWNQYQQSMPKAYGKTSFPTYICGYSPKQIRSAYSLSDPVAHGANGKGVTVAIIDAYGSPTMRSDANAYAAAMGEPAFRPGQYQETLFTPFDLQDLCGDWSDEEALDVESVHSMAPAATVHYFGAQDCDTGIDDAANYIVQHHSADIVSNSYGWGTEALPADALALEHSIYLQAVLEGIGFYFSTGDDGDNADLNDGVPQPSYASSDPLVTGVGGTSLAVGSHGQYLFETGWGSVRDAVDYSGATPVYTEPPPGSDFWGGGGGGVSTLFTEPFYQRGKVPSSLARSRGGAAMRVSPDVSAVGDPYTGFAVGLTIDGEFVIGGIGGTSLACPLIAGIQADASTHRRFPLGFANPLLYAVSGFALRDVPGSKAPVAVTSPNAARLVTFDLDTTLTTTRGYDDVTGLGTPIGPRLLAAEAH